MTGHSGLWFRQKGYVKLCILHDNVNIDNSYMGRNALENTNSWLVCETKTPFGLSKSDIEQSHTALTNCGDLTTILPELALDAVAFSSKGAAMVCIRAFNANTSPRHVGSKTV